MSSDDPDLILVDARPLQDDGYRRRGVGQHGQNAVDALRRRRWNERRPRFVALLDPALPKLLPEQALLFDEQVEERSPLAVSRLRAEAQKLWLISLSPMTHDPLWLSDLMQDRSLYKVALFHDLIPLAQPDRYLRTSLAANTYVMALAWLRQFDAFAANSRFTATELVETLGLDAAKVFVTGVALRADLAPRSDQPSLPAQARNAVLVAGGGDPRKNPAAVVLAWTASEQLLGCALKLQLFGGYQPAERAELRKLFAKRGGRPEALEFLDHISDAELRDAYRHARVTVVPSRAEGFSIPVIESAASGTPVIASNVGAHPELLTPTRALFDPDDIDRLGELLCGLVKDQRAWESLRREQADLWRPFIVEEVRARIVSGILDRAPQRTPKSPAVGRHAKAALAVLTPLPPAQSGVADYSAATIQPLAGLVDLHVFTPTPGARIEPGWTSLQSVAAADLTRHRFDATLSVMGNSHHHFEIFQYLMRHGGACLAHDARQIDFYVHLLGADRSLEVASAEARRPVGPEELDRWLHNPRDLDHLFLSEIARASNPLMVHSPTTAQLIQEIYGVAPKLLPFACYRSVDVSALRGAGRDQARARLGIGSHDLMLCTFGGLGLDRAPEDLLWAVEMLRSWGVEASLTFCGAVAPSVEAHVRHVAAELGLSDHIRLFATPPDENAYVDHLLAADVGLQLRKYFLGGLSGALNDCMSFGLPTVSNEHLASAMQAPAFVRRVPDNLSPVLIAEAVLEILASGQHRERPIEEVAAYRSARSPERYAQKVLEALQLEPAGVAPSR